MIADKAMLASSHAEPRRSVSPGADYSGGYGWVSIVLHWATVAVFFPLWIVGYAISHSGHGSVDARINLHTTMAACAYVLLWARVLWRYRQGHADPLPRQGGWSFQLGKAVHYLLVLAIAVMLISGPVLAWTGNGSIQVFSATIPSPLPRLQQLSSGLTAVHRTTSRIIMLAVLLHTCGVLKHVMVDHDGTLSRMLTPARRKTAR